MNIVDIAGAAATIGTLLSAVLVFDAWADHRAVEKSPDRALLKQYTLGRLSAESFRFFAQACFFAAALIAKLRVPGTFQMTVRVLLVAVPILLAVSSVVSWRAKRRLLAEVNGE